MMTNADKTAISNIILAMTNEEKAFIPRLIPSRYMIEELERRNEVANNTLSNVWDIITKGTKEMSLEEMQGVINELRTALKGA
jgi:hypothetical protein